MHGADAGALRLILVVCRRLILRKIKSIRRLPVRCSPLARPSRFVTLTQDNCGLRLEA